MRGKGERKWRVDWGAVFKVCDFLESYDLASLLAEKFLLADSQPIRLLLAFSPDVEPGGSCKTIQLSQEKVSKMSKYKADHTEIS